MRVVFFTQHKKKIMDYVQLRENKDIELGELRHRGSGTDVPETVLDLESDPETNEGASCDQRFVKTIRYLEESNCGHVRTLQTKRDFYWGLISVAKKGEPCYWMSTGHPYYSIAGQQVEWRDKKFIVDHHSDEMVCMVGAFVDVIVDLVYEMWEGQ